MSLCARVLSIEINGVEQAVTGGSLRQFASRNVSKVDPEKMNLEHLASTKYVFKVSFAPKWKKSFNQQRRFFTCKPIV